jgi:hypothetical protein
MIVIVVTRGPFAPVSASNSTAMPPLSASKRAGGATALRRNLGSHRLAKNAEATPAANTLDGAWRHAISFRPERDRLGLSESDAPLVP